jgi:SAM-dependent methyltransferase
MSIDTRTQSQSVPPRARPTRTIVSLLDSVEGLILGGQSSCGMHLLFSGLREYYLTSDGPAWEEVVAACRHHRVRSLVHQDPVTRRSHDKPRGYAGDAELLDLIYRRTPPFVREEESRLGLDLYRFWDNEPGASAVRRRRELIASLIDEVIGRAASPRILAVAAGHLRELDLCRGLDPEGQLDLVALDQDPLSLEEVRRSYGALGVTTLCAKVASLILGRLRSGHFDLIYAAGLYDYLDEDTSVRLTSTLLGMLKPGGRLVFANFLPAIYAIGYMKTFMDWHLIHRDTDELLALAARAADDRRCSMRTFVEENINISFADIVMQ